MTVQGGPDGEVYLPCIYAATKAQGDDSLRLGRGSDWRGGDGQPVQGLGLKMFLIGDQSRTVLEMKEVSFESPVSVSATEE
jgi:type VI secretion system protein ImpE